MLCEYGCGKPALHVLKNGKNCCSKYWASCPVNKKKNSEGLKKAFAEGRKNRNVFTEEQRNKSNQKAKDAAAQKLLKGNYTGNNDDIKKILYGYFNIAEECQGCGISEWQGKKLSLHLEHINGNSRDNRIENLKILCPNCHSLTPTYCGKNINSGKTKVSDENFKMALKNNKSIYSALKELGLSGGLNYNRAYKLLEQI